VVGWAMVGLAGLIAVGAYYALCIAGAAEQRGKRAVELGGGSLTREQVKSHYHTYAAFFEKPKQIETEHGSRHAERFWIAPPAAAATQQFEPEFQRYGL
jgi:hypothetical protein